MSGEATINLDTFKPRSYQTQIFDAIENQDCKRVMAIWPRRAGKDLVAWNLCIRELLRSPKIIYYVFPTFAQGRRILWDNMTMDGVRMLDYLPSELIKDKNEQLMRIRLKNGSLFQVLGSNSYDNTVVGTNAKGVVFSEFALSDPMAYKLSRPILSANNGWALIISTPRGKNFMWDMYRIAQENPQEWSLSKLTVDDTKHIPMETIMKERELGEMSEDLQMQEYWTSFELGVEGAYYIRYIDQLNLKGQICDVPWDPSLPVHTAWDLGVNDMTVIIFFQVVGQKIAIIDFYDKNKEGMEYYVNYLKSKPYTYGEHICPHDIGVYDFSSSMTRWEKARQLGVNLRVAAKLSLQDGIEAVRSILLRTWIDKKKCEPLIRALENYRQEYDSKRKVYKRHPVHDNFSHACDAMRYLAIELPHLGPSMTAEDLKKLKAEVYREQYGQNAYF